MPGVQMAPDQSSVCWQVSESGWMCSHPVIIQFPQAVLGVTRQCLVLQDRRRERSPTPAAVRSSAAPAQVQSVQRNVAANAQRKFLTTFSLPRDYAGQPLQPTFPVELRDVLLLSVSPSGAPLPLCPVIAHLRLSRSRVACFQQSAMAPAEDHTLK